MSLVDLSSYTSVQSSVFVSIDISGYGLINFSNHMINLTIDGVNYNSLGSMLSITEATNELTATDKKITITLSGIPAVNNEIVQDYNIKGSPITITRAFFNPVTGLLLDQEGNPAVRFVGIVTNFGIQEDFDSVDQTATNTVILDCASIMVLLRNKIQGRKTNPDNFTADRSFDRIPQLSQSNFNFGGKPK